MNFPYEWKDSKKILIGHSRGGGDVILAGRNLQEEIDAIVTWAAIADIEERFPKGDQLSEWKENKVMHVQNARTNQMMPHDISFYQDYLDNQDSLHIESAAKSLGIPWLILHGDQDQAVSLDNAKRLQSWSNTQLHVIANATHTFNTAHPFNQENLPIEAQELVDITRSFLDQL